MEMKRLSNLTMAFSFGLLILAASTANAQLGVIATGILPTLLPCQSFLTSLLPIMPSQQCCAAAANVTTEASPSNLCQCLKLNLLGSGLLPFKLNLIPNLCSLTNLVPIVGCILGSTPPNTPPSASNGIRSLQPSRSPVTTQ